jgi:hypothetical protein
VLERALIETAQVMSEFATDARGIPAPTAKVVAVTDQVASAADKVVPVRDETQGQGNRRVSSRTFGLAGHRQAI